MNSKLYGTALVVLAWVSVPVAKAGSIFEIGLEPSILLADPGQLVDFDLVLRETFDGDGQSLLAMSGGDGLFSFSAEVQRLSSTSGTPANLSAGMVAAVFEPLLSDVTVIDSSSLLLRGAIPPSKASGPIFSNDVISGAGVFTLPLGQVTVQASSVIGDVTSFDIAIHPDAETFEILSGAGVEIPVEFGSILGQVQTVPEPASVGIFALAFFVAGLACRGRAKA